MSNDNNYDVIIVGGRPAGATLAARLGQRGWRVLLLERNTLPSLPGASCPIIYASTMSLLDEIGADERDYAANTPQLRRMVNDSEGIKGEVWIPSAGGRDYGYAIDRARFDKALWDNALRFPTVTGRDGYSVVDLLWDADRVIGVVGKAAGGKAETITADLVVGADGRFSTVARKAKAAERDEHDEHPTSLLYAYWRGVTPYDDKGAAAVAGGVPGQGYGYLVMDSADETTLIAVEGQAQLLEPPPGQAEAFYLGLVNAYPPIRARIHDAERVTTVRGMRKIGNLYRQPGGAGWALVGDAYHQKDPLDGQGIFDAVFTAKVLAEAIDAWKCGEATWDDALAWYDRVARAETHPVYMSTLRRVQDNFYRSAPPWFNKLAVRTWGRWLMEDRLVQEQLGQILTRQLKPNEALSTPIMLGAMLRGPLRDLSDFLDKEAKRYERI
ncbi:MAG: FAD-dependent monooxygenase [Chloroflexi bacterium]|nr:FAD-dependent monooxygenase [Chloroflexota bacterium]